MDLASVHLRMKAATAVARLPFRAGLWAGVAGSILGQGTGTSIDFQDQRPYLPGDDPRHINWQAYARTGHYTMKLYRREVTPRVDLIFDTSGSMFVHEAKAARSWDLLYFCLESALRLGASLQVHALCDRAIAVPLEQALAHDWPVPGPHGARPDPALVMGRVPLRAGSLRVLVADLLDETPPERVTALLSAGRGRAVILAPFCNEESQPDWSGNIEFEDAEAGTRERRRVERDVLERYRRAYETHFAMWREQCTRHGVALGRVASEPDFLTALRAEAAGAGAVEM